MPHASRVLIGLCLLVLVGCDTVRYATLDAAATLPQGAARQDVFISSPPDPLAQSTIAGAQRPDKREWSQWTVSIPPTHERGQIEWLPSQRATANNSFIVAADNRYQNRASFIGDIAKAAAGGDVVVYVHGFNTTVSEAAFRAVQMKHDFEQSQPSVVFAWPSAAAAAGYLYDRDSILFARDELRNLVRDLSARRDVDRVILVAHSLGAVLVMETLRDLRQETRASVRAVVGGVVLIAPDVDPQVFRRQASAIGDLPNPFVVFTSQQDRALRLSSLFVGGQPRLGTLDSIEQLRGLDITLVDMSAIDSNEPLNHFPVAGSKEVVDLILKMRDRGGLQTLGTYVEVRRPPRAEIQ
ncbi:alpha/beta hydrolase [Nereida sp. MMG025]|uniref:alpha/beta hydrolase n=1 Tax=Nereida sp. MMG025 TaxID=2909981 RepID=UPI001F15F4C1|nr:alpha/beta fold hydrolase [Nereida sp. MMG025]MCF6443206.1 alpha/beta fold hydrolase [Nereida sp. MMG025]